jgi:DNA-binding transcriptional LysR family regulator
LQHFVAALEQSMKDLNDLQFFVHVSRARSFTAAAKQLGVPKSSVSRAIARLEARLGIQLVERTTRRVALTEAGTLYLERCQRVMEEAEQADLIVGELQTEPRGMLCIGAPVVFARAVLAPILGEFMLAYPGLRVRLQTLPGQPSAHDPDVVVRPGPLESSGSRALLLTRIPLGVYASPSYCADHPPPQSPAALRDHSCIAKNCGTSNGVHHDATWRLSNGVSFEEVRIEARVTVPDPALGHQLAVAGVGIALMSHALAQADVDAGRLVRILPEWEPAPIELHAVYSTRLSASPNVRVFLEFLRKRFMGNSALSPRLHSAAIVRSAEQFEMAGSR